MQLLTLSTELLVTISRGCLFKKVVLNNLACGLKLEEESYYFVSVCFAVYVVIVQINKRVKKLITIMITSELKAMLSRFLLYIGHPK